MKFIKRCLLISTILFYCCNNNQFVKSEIDFSNPPLIRVGQPLRFINSNPNCEILLSHSEKLKLECIADYPVQWIYYGSGSCTFNSNTLIDSELKNGEIELKHKAELEINSTKEGHTGEYRCTSTESPHSNTFLYIYVPGQAVFVPTSGRYVLFSSNDTSVTIPCTVSNKKAKVSLHKSEGGILSDPIQHLDQYNPRIGFRVSIDRIRSKDPSGNYVCTATLANLFRIIEYTVTPREHFGRTNRTSCDDPSPCARNAHCSINNKRVMCQCIKGFLGDPYGSTGCQKSCEKNNDCSVQTFCNTTLNTCENPCENYACDSKLTLCKVTNNFPRCYKSDTLPPENVTIQLPQCRNDNECPLSQVCDYPSCINICQKFDPCNKVNNSVCKIVRHVPVCELPPSRSNVSKRQPSQSACDDRFCPVFTTCNVVSGKGRCSSIYDECKTHDDCFWNRACHYGKCWDPCTNPNACNASTVCSVQNHDVICTKITTVEILGNENDYGIRCPLNLCSENKNGERKRKNRTRPSVPLLFSNRVSSSTQHQLVLY